MVLPYEPQNSCAQKSLSSAPRRQDCRSALFFNFILSILRKKVKLLPAKCTAPGKFFCEQADFCLFCRHPAPLDRGKMVCYTFDHRSGRKPDTGGQQPAAYPSKHIFLKQPKIKKGSAPAFHAKGRPLRGVCFKKICSARCTSRCCCAALCWAARGGWLWALPPRCCARCCSGCRTGEAFLVFIRVPPFFSRKIKKGSAPAFHAKGRPLRGVCFKKICLLG